MARPKPMVEAVQLHVRVPPGLAQRAREWADAQNMKLNPALTSLIEAGLKHHRMFPHEG